HQGPSRAWTKVLKKYLTADTFRSPLDTTGRTCSYAINDFVTSNPYGAEDMDYSRLQGQSHPSQTLYMSVLNASQQNSDHFHFADPDGGHSSSAFKSEVWVELINGGCNYLFLDGHVEKLNWQNVQTKLSQPDSKFIRPDGKN
ncbi:MAG: H-X9-DG-CTERM domain-containing protein, partial [Chthoniobacterales bacterium]